MRLTAGWTQEELAQRMTDAGFPLHQTTVTKLENGTRPTNVGEVGALAELFGVSVATLFADPDELGSVIRTKTLQTRVRVMEADLTRVELQAAELMDRRASLLSELAATKAELARLDPTAEVDGQDR